MKLLRIAVLGLFAALVSDVGEASIAVTSNNAGGYAGDHSGVGSYSSFSGTAIPTSTTFDAIEGISFSKNAINWSTSGGITVFALDMDHHRDGLQNSRVSTAVSALRFTTTSNTTYELSGYYNVLDVAANGSGSVNQSAELIDETSGAQLFFNYQDSVATHNEQFVLGAAGGDNFNSLVGSLTGNLIGGHSYYLYFSSAIQNYPDYDLGASALGNVTLKIGGITAAPEPISAFIWTGLATFIGFATQRRPVARGTNRI